jgi:serine phosphatase RsbU (regulator of sigma subunit)
MASVLSVRITEALNETIRNLHVKNQKLEQAYNELKEAQEKIIEKEKLEHSLQVAREIQFSILPVKIPQMNGYDIGAMMAPAQAVGGDFFGVYPLDETHMALIVGDVADKGMPAAIFMAQTHALLRATIEKSMNPSDVLRRVNELMLEMNAQSLFATVIYGVLDGSNGEFRYVRAGHELPLILEPNGKVSFPEKGKGQALGVFDNPTLDERSLIIPRGGMMLLYSDGVPDDRSESGKTFDQEGLVKIVEKLGVDIPAQDVCRMIFNTLFEFQNGESQFDDVTLLAAKRL